MSKDFDAGQRAHKHAVAIRTAKVRSAADIAIVLAHGLIQLQAYPFALLEVCFAKVAYIAFVAAGNSDALAHSDGS